MTTQEGWGEWVREEPNRTREEDAVPRLTLHASDKLRHLRPVNARSILSSWVGQSESRD